MLFHHGDYSRPQYRSDFIQCKGTAAAARQSTFRTAVFKKLALVISQEKSSTSCSSLHSPRSPVYDPILDDNHLPAYTSHKPHLMYALISLSRSKLSMLATVLTWLTELQDTNPTLQWRPFKGSAECCCHPSAAHLEGTRPLVQCQQATTKSRCHSQQLACSYEPRCSLPPLSILHISKRI